MRQIVVNMMTKINTYWHNSRIIAMKPDPVGGVGVVEFPLEQQEVGVVPGRVTYTDLLNDATNI
jgi:hypothetical protein